MIHLKNVTLIKDNKYLVKDISLNIEEGQGFMLEGMESQALGYLYSILDGRLLPTEGEYLFEGRSLKDFSKLERARLRKNIIINLMDTVFFNNSFTVGKNLQQQLKNTGLYPTKWKTVINQVLKDLAIEDLRDKAGMELTSLQLMQAKIAKAVVVGPRLMLISPDLFKLQLKERVIIEEILNNILKKGVTIIIGVTSDII